MRWQPSWVSRPKASGDVAADYRADPNPTPIYMLQGATGEKRRNAPLFFTWLGLAPDPLRAITSRCNCEHTTPRAVKQSKQSHKQVHADTCSRSHTHTHVVHARVHLAWPVASKRANTHNSLWNANACTLQTGPPQRSCLQHATPLFCDMAQKSRFYRKDTSTEPRPGYTMALVGRAGGRKSLLAAGLQGLG